MKGDTYKETIHDGSVSYSVIRVAPLSGTGKHAKTSAQVERRHRFNRLFSSCKPGSAFYFMLKAEYRNKWR